MIPFPETIPEAALRPAAWALVHFLWQGALVAFAVAGVLRLLRGGCARLRYLAAAAGLGVMALLPLVTAVHLTAAGGGAAVSTAGAPPGEGRFAGPDPAGATAAVPPPETVPVRERFEVYLPWLVAAWLLGVALLTLAHLGGWSRVRRLRRESVPAPERWEAALGRLAERLGVARPVALLESARVRVPVLLGWIRPAILVPASTFTGLSPQQLEAVLAHELAHVRRHDYLVNLFQLVVETLLFYHPGVWWVSRQVRIERENCCDDLAVGLCPSPLAYARALADLEELRFGSPALALGADGGSLLLRVRRLVGRDEEKPAGGFLAAVVAALVATLAAVLGVVLLFLASSSSAMPAAEGQGQDREDESATELAADATSEPDGRWIPAEPASEDAWAEWEPAPEDGWLPGQPDGRWLPGEPDVRWLPGEPDVRWLPGEPDGELRLAWAEPQEEEARQDDEDDRGGRRRVRSWRESDGGWLDEAVEDLRRAVAGTPYEKLTEDDLSDLVRRGFEPDLIPVLVEAGITGASAGELEDLARHGIDADDLREYHHAGFPGLSIDDVVELARHGVDGGDVRAYQEAGLAGLSVEQMVTLARRGVDGEDVRDFTEAGLKDLSVDEIVTLARHGVDGEDARDYARSGYTGLSIDDLVDLSRHGVDGEDVRDFQEAGYKNLSVGEMIDLARNGIDGEDVRDFREAGLEGLTVGEMIDLARNGVDGEDVRDFRKAGYENLSVGEMIDLARNGVDGDDLKALRDAGHDLSVEEVIRLARRGRLDEMMDE